MKRLVVECVEKWGKCWKHNVGDQFEVKKGTIYLPKNKHICLYALNSILPLIPAKERTITVEGDDWLPRVNRVMCPDPEGQLIFEIREYEDIGDETTEDWGED
ncbi:MAG: TIGR04076 family protein [Candidatus Hodarchaeota archaeon]